MVVGSPARLIITADDYGYAAGYDEGMLEAARAGAIDAAGAMVLRAPSPEPLIATGVEVGLHLEALERVPAAEQLAEFERLFLRPAAFIDGHHHCHAAPGGPALEVARLARRRAIAVRSVSPRHRRLLRCQGVATADRLLGRLVEDEPALPGEIEAMLAGKGAPGVSEWMTHPGRPDSSSGSSYDRGRLVDLELLLELGDRAAWRARGIERVGPSALAAGP